MSDSWERRFDALVRAGARLGLTENGVLLACAVAVGVVAALGVVAFYDAIDLAYAVFVRWPASFASRAHFLFYRPLLTGGALTLAWHIWRRGGRGADGATVPDVQLAVVRRRGRVPLGPTVARTVAS